MKFKIEHIIILLLTCYVVILSYCKPNITLKESVVIYDTIVKDSIISKPKIIYTFIDSTIYNIERKDSVIIDTNRIVFDYLFTHNVFSDSLMLDTNGYVILTDTLFRNKIKARSYSFTLHQKTSVNNNFTYGCSKTLSLGVLASNNLLAPFVSSDISDNWRLYGGYNLTQNSPIFGVSYKINYKRNLLGKK